MMKFLRKYNKHLLAVFMALLLVVWLAGDALSSLTRQDEGALLVGRGNTGAVTQRDLRSAERLTALQEFLGLNWRQQLTNPQADADERVEYLEWVLLRREAEDMGLTVTPERARTILELNGFDATRIRQAAAQLELSPSRRMAVTADDFYIAAADYFTVMEMISMYEQALRLPEPRLRVAARDAYERASIEAVNFPADAFTDPEQTFSEAEVQAQFDAFRDKERGRGLNFGYYLQPTVRLEVITINPSLITSHLRGSDAAFLRRALQYWKDNKTEFRRNPVEMDNLRKKAQEAFDKAVADAGSNGTPPEKPEPVSPFYESFSEVQAEALAAVRRQAAETEAERIANTLAQALAEPWFEAPSGPGEYAVAPEFLKADDYYASILKVIPATLSYPEGVTVTTTDWMSQEDILGHVEYGTARLELADGNTLAMASLAFNVEGLMPLPVDERIDRNLYLARYESPRSPLIGPDGTLFLFRVVDAQPGRAPEAVDEVRDQVVEDLRTLAGMDAAEKAAESFAATVADRTLQTAWDDPANEELVAKITPDRGGFVVPPPFPRQAASRLGSEIYVIPLVGEVDKSVVDTAFELAAEGQEAPPRIVRVAAEARVVVLQGRELQPLYQEIYAQRRNFLRQQMTKMVSGEMLMDWLNAKQIRERNGFKLGREA